MIALSIFMLMTGFALGCLFCVSVSIGQFRIFLKRQEERPVLPPHMGEYR